MTDHTKLLSEDHVCIDDFGMAIYRCRYTGQLVSADAAVLIGATMPGIAARYVIAPTQEAMELNRASIRAFHESEANCNTCLFLKRENHKRDRAGFLYGSCTSQDSKLEENLYFGRGPNSLMMFHPSDPMHMSCYVPRWANERSAHA